MDHPTSSPTRRRCSTPWRFVRGMSAHPALNGRLLLTAAADRGSQDLVTRLGDWDGRVDALRTGRRDRRPTWCAPRRNEFRLFEQAFEMSSPGSTTCSTPPRADPGPRAGRALDALAEGLRTFAGAGRRMELIADTAGGDRSTTTTRTIRPRCAPPSAPPGSGGGRRLWAVFEPHMYSRTALLFDEFTAAFTDADEVVIAEIFASRDTGGDGAPRARRWPMPSSALRRTRHRRRRRRRHDRLRRRAPRRGDAVLVMGAGKSYRIARARRAAGGGNP